MKSAALTFKSKSTKPFCTEKNGPLYDGYNWMFMCDKKDFTFDEAYNKCLEMVEKLRVSEGYDVGIAHKRYNSCFRWQFGVLFGKKIDEKGEN